MGLLITLALLWILWLLTPKKRRRFWIQIVAVITVSTWFLFSPFAVRVAMWGLTQALPANSDISVDTIVVLGRGEEQRPNRSEAVRDLWQSHRAPQIFASGMLDARFILEYLKEQGVPANALIGEECSQSTGENALFTSVILTPEKVQKILLVTDSPHMWRSLLLFQQQGFQVIPHTISLPSVWKPRYQMLIIAREYLVLLQYLVSHRFNVNLNIDFERPPLTTLEAASSRLKEWNCKVEFQP